MCFQGLLLQGESLAYENSTSFPKRSHCHTVTMETLKSFPAESDNGNTEYKLHLKNPDAQKFDRLVTQLQHRMTEGDGECIYEIGVMDDGSLQGLSREDMDALVKEITS